MSEKKIRFSLLASVSVVIIIIFTFLWAININQPESLRAVLDMYLVILCCFTIGAMIVFFIKSEILEEDGTLERGRILVMTTTVLIIAQLAFAFASYAYNELNFTFDTMYNSSGLHLQIIEDEIFQNQNDVSAINQMLRTYQLKYDEIDVISIIDTKNKVRFSSNTALSGQIVAPDPLKSYTFPIENGQLLMHVSEDFRSNSIKSILAELLTIMAASVFLTIELMLFVLKFFGDKITPPPRIDGKKSSQALQYVRQLAFVFYFASRMASSFIPIIAKELGGSLFGMTGNILASIPQSVEMLLTCVAIFLTSIVIERKGWKMPFVGGLFLVAAGTLLSAFSPTILLFIVSRAIVGLGYGFCWMTLRNFSLFGRNESEKATGFSLLNAGLYAGINCGAVLGSILADRLGYELVFLLASFFTILCSVFVIRMENARYIRPVDTILKKTEKQPLSSSDKLQLLVISLFVILMIVPTAISGSYLNYYLPIYFLDTGHTVSDVGRAQLLYGLLIIYVGPYLVKTRHLQRWTYGYSIFVAIAFIMFGLIGGFIPAMATVLLLGVSDSFGFVMQNNYFLKFKLLRRLGESMSLSLLSFLKKMAEMLGPITFAVVMIGGGTMGIAILGIVFLVATIIYILFLGNRAKLIS